MNVSFFALSGLINFLFTLAIAFFVLLSRRKDKVVAAFSFYSLLVAFWSFGYFFWQISDTYEQAYFWCRFLMSFAIYIPVAYLLFVFSFLNRLREQRVHIVLSVIFYTGMLFLNLFTSLYIADVVPLLTFKYWPLAGPFYHIFLLMWLFHVIYPTYLLYKETVNGHMLKRQQAKFMFWGLLISFSGGITNYLLWYKIPVYPLGNILVPAFVIMAAYAIVRHRFLDLKLALRRLVANGLVILAVFAFYAAVYFLYIRIYNVVINPPIFFFLLTVAVTSVYGIDRLAYILRKITDRFLFSAIYDRNKLLKDLGGVLSSTLGFEDVMPKLHGVLSEAMHIKYVNFGLRLTGRKDVPSELVSTKGDFASYYFGEGEVIGSIPSYLQQVMPAGHKALLYDDLAYAVEDAMDRNLRRLKQWMSDRQVGVILPLYIKDDLIGYIILGEKRNGDAFTSEDVAVLETFAIQAAIGIENILLFMYMRDFNRQLKNSVDRATGQLKEKNKTLELLRKMDSIITTSLELQDVCQKIVDTLSWELGYDITYLSLVDEKRGVLKPMAVAHTPIAEKAAAIVSGYEDTFEISITETSHPIMKVFTEGKRFESEHLTEVFAGKVPDNVLRSLHEIHQIQGVLVYPIFAKQKAIGTLLLAIPIAPAKLTASEMELLEEFVKEVGIALDNAMLYEEGKRTNQALIDTNKKLIELDRMKDEFVSIASHELRTPMTAINSYVWMALNKGGVMSDKAKDYLGKVAISTQRLIDLVNDMLNVSRIESGRVEVKHEPFDVVALIRDVHEELQIKANERHLELSFDYAGASVNVDGDANKIREVLTNFLGNSLKFTEQGKVWTTLELKRRDVDGQPVEWVEVAVSDTGRGIAQDDMQRLFTKFGRLENELSTIAQTQGTGLGLFICKKYLEAMHGEVGAESELGKGSRFWFRLRKA